MLFKKRKENKGENLTYLKSGTSVEISQLNDTNFLYAYKSKLEQFLTNKEVVLLAPIKNRSVVKLAYGVKYGILFKTDTGIFKNTMKVTSYDIKDNIPLIRVTLLEKNIKIQRRESFRLNTSLHFNFDIVPNSEDGTLESTDILLSEGKTIDISSGGIKFLTNEDIEENSFIKILIKVENLFMIGIATVIYKEKTIGIKEYRYCYKCKFENLPQKYKEDLSRYIFDTQRELSKKGKIY